MKSMISHYSFHGFLNDSFEDLFKVLNEYKIDEIVTTVIIIRVLYNETSAIELHAIFNWKPKYRLIDFQRFETLSILYSVIEHWLYLLLYEVI